MLLQIGEDGIKEIINNNTNVLLDEMWVGDLNKINGVLTRSENVINYGYNEIIVCETEELAKDLIRLILSNRVSG